MYTQMRASTFAKSHKPKPQLARCYEEATQDIFSHGTWVVEKWYYRFYTFEKRLADADIWPRDFTYDVTIALYGWARNKGFNHIPLPSFCSDLTWNVYNRIHRTKFVRVIRAGEDAVAMALYGELMLARLYIDAARAGQPISMTDAYKQVKVLIPKEWDSDCRPIKYALKVLAMEYCVHDPKNYTDIARRAC